MANLQVNNEEREEAPNPYIFNPSLPWYRLLQIIIMSLTIAPVRLVLMSMTHLLGCLIALITMFGIDDEELARAPLSGWKRSVRYFVFKLGRLGTMFSGYTWVKVKGTQASPAEAPILVVAPHSTLMDIVIIFMLRDCPGIVAKKEIASMPVVGSLLKFTQPILVSRDASQTNQTVTEEISRRSNSGGLWHQTLIFPEGTTTNRKALAPFKSGAFRAGRPVQPITVRFTDQWDTATWTWVGGPPGWVQGWLSMCKLNIGLTIEFLPIYHPSVEEMTNPNLYAENVQKVMASSLGVSCSHLTIKDARNMAKLMKGS